MKCNVSILLPFAGILLVAALSGCGGRATSDYKPSETSARDALTTALTAWKEGKTPDVAAQQGHRTMQFGDFDRAAGKRLKAYQILSDEPKQDGSAQAFRVWLELEGEAAKEVEYFVVGLDPLWILRDRDYHQASMQ